MNLNDHDCATKNQCFKFVFSAQLSSITNNSGYFFLYTMFVIIGLVVCVVLFQKYFFSSSIVIKSDKTCTANKGWDLYTWISQWLGITASCQKSVCKPCETSDCSWQSEEDEQQYASCVIDPCGKLPGEKPIRLPDLKSLRRALIQQLKCIVSIADATFLAQASVLPSNVIAGNQYNLSFIRDAETFVSSIERQRGKFSARRLYSIYLSMLYRINDFFNDLQCTYPECFVVIPPCSTCPKIDVQGFKAANPTLASSAYGLFFSNQVYLLIRELFQTAFAPSYNQIDSCSVDKIYEKVLRILLTNVRSGLTAEIFNSLIYYYNARIAIFRQNTFLNFYRFADIEATVFDLYQEEFQRLQTLIDQNNGSVTFQQIAPIVLPFTGSMDKIATRLFAALGICKPETQQ